MEKSGDVGDQSPSQDSIIEGLVKFRDGKKWKTRWCVIKKLSPVADCIHLVLYRDAKDRLKGALPKASVALRHYLGCESGFTLDREAHTLALLCRGGGAVLALGAPDSLLLWRTRAARALAPGGCSRWPGSLVAPPASGVRGGPVALHVRPARFCIVAGVPPKVVGVWNIADLRRYGVVDGGVCFEAGSRCGKLGGAWLIRTDRPHLLVAALDAAAPMPNKGNEESQNQLNKRFSEISESTKSISNIGFSPGWNLYNGHQQSETASSVGYNDSASVSEGNSSEAEPRAANRQMYLGKCVSCMSRLGSPTSPIGNNSLFGAWATDSVIERRSDSDRASLYSQSSGGTSDYSIPRGICVADGSTVIKPTSVCGLLPSLRPKSLCPCRHSQKFLIGPYENYDVPRPPMPLIHEYPKKADVSSTEPIYDKPKNIAKCLLSNGCNCSNALKHPEMVISNKGDGLIESITNSNIDTVKNSGNQSNYVNIEPINQKSQQHDDNYCKNLSDLSVTLEKFESSAEILRNAGFSQDEIDELENTSDREIPLNPYNKNSDMNIPNIENTKERHAGYLLMQPVESSTQSSSALNCSIDVSGSTKFNENPGLSRRKSSSADFLKKAEEFFDISKSNSHKDVSVDLNPLRKNTIYECVNNNCTRCAKVPPDTKSCVNQNLPENNVKPENMLLSKFKESVKIRRSCSVPSKTIKNRDSSSSNDSGVSTGSLKHHRCDFSDLELISRNLCARHMYFNRINRKTIDISSSSAADTMQQISFQFDKAFQLRQSRSCDSESIQCVRRDARGFSGSDAQNLRSPSSCSSEVSDYQDTLSVSSISSSEVCSRSTSRPRSGREYSSILPVQTALRLTNACHCCVSAQIV